MNALRSTFVALTIVAAVAAAVYAYVAWVPFGEYPGDEFFDLAAQTIPILLVALAVETQVRGFDRARHWKLMRICAVILLGAGETTAVMISAGLLHPEFGSTALDVFVVVTAIGLLGGFLCVIAVAVSTAPQSIGGGIGTSLRRQSPELDLGQLSPAAQPGHTPRKAVPAAAFFLIGVVLVKALAECAGRYPRTNR